MSRINRESQISIGKKDIKVSEFLKTLIYLPGESVRDFFIDLGLTIPREIRMFALRETLRVRVIETKKTRLTLADELNYRLSWFSEFCETQLEHLLVFFDDRDLDKDFLEEFWVEVLNYMLTKGVIAETFHHLYEMSVLHVKQNGLVLPVMKTYNKTIKDIFFDNMGRIDGLTLKKIRPVLYKSSTLGEIRDLGEKYGVDVPRRLKKDQLADIIVKELKERNQYSESVEKDIRKMSVILLQRYAIDHDIKASTELKKEEIIEYILKNAKETKEAYFVPKSYDDYNQEVHDVSGEKVEDEVELKPQPEPQPEKEVASEPVEEEVNQEEVVEEEVTQEEVIEEKPEEIIEEEPLVEEPIKEEVIKIETKKETPAHQPVYQSADFHELTQELKKIRELFERLVQPEQEDQDVEDQPLSEELGEAKEPLIVNSVDFYGKPKSFKKALKKDEVEEREQFIEKQKELAKDDPSIAEDIKKPGEVRALIATGKFLWKILKVILKFGLILAIIALVLVILYAAVSRFTGFEVAAINNNVNSIQIAGKGLYDHIIDLLASLGI
ncbi:MAG: hypothetical protein ACNA7K_00525 [Acholeplasmataceae bacterium]